MFGYTVRHALRCGCIQCRISVARTFSNRNGNVVAASPTGTGKRGIVCAFILINRRWFEGVGHPSSGGENVIDLSRARASKIWRVASESLLS